MPAYVIMEKIEMHLPTIRDTMSRFVQGIPDNVLRIHEVWLLHSYSLRFGEYAVVLNRCAVAFFSSSSTFMISSFLDNSSNSERMIFYVSQTPNSFISSSKDDL